jgi:hypothetical protein
MPELFQALRLPLHVGGIRSSHDLRITVGIAGGLPSRLGRDGS